MDIGVGVRGGDDEGVGSRAWESVILSQWERERLELIQCAPYKWNAVFVIFVHMINRIYDELLLLMSCKLHEIYNSKSSKEAMALANYDDTGL